MEKNETQSSTNKSTGTISTTKGFSSTPIASAPRSEGKMKAWAVEQGRGGESGQPARPPTRKSGGGSWARRGGARSREGGGGVTGGEEEEITAVKERTGPVKKKETARSDLRRNSRRTLGLPAVGTSGVSRDSRQSGLSTNVGTSDAGEQKNTLTCMSSTMWGKNMMDTNVFTGD